MSIENELDDIIQKELMLILNKEELLLLDWVLHYPAPDSLLECEAAMAWKALRFKIWAAIHKLENEEQRANAEGHKVRFNEVPIILDNPEDAHILLALVPTTFRWGAGDDSGYSLKLKLYRYITGEEAYYATSADDPKNKAHT